MPSLTDRVGRLLQEAHGELPEQLGLSTRLADMVLELYQRQAPSQSAIKDALEAGLQLAESGGRGNGPQCPTCHFVRQAKAALGLPTTAIEQPTAQ